MSSSADPIAPPRFGGAKPPTTGPRQGSQSLLDKLHRQRASQVASKTGGKPKSAAAQLPKETLRTISVFLWPTTVFPPSELFQDATKFLSSKELDFRMEVGDLISAVEVSERVQRSLADIFPPAQFEEVECVVPHAPCCPELRSFIWWVQVVPLQQSVGESSPHPRC